MPEFAGLDELDSQLITALQTAPRAGWSQIGSALDVSATTAARRWQRLTAAGLAWLSCHPMRLPGAVAVVAVIEVTCAADRLHAIAASIADDPHVFTVGYVTGDSDLQVTAAFVDRVSLSRYLAFRLRGLPGVTATRTHIATAVHTEGSRWRLDRLGAGSREQLGARTRPATGGRPGPDSTDMLLMAALNDDCRQPVGTLAARTGLSPTSVRRRLERLESGRLIAYRCEVARYASGWPVAVTFWGTVPADRAEAVVAQVARLREVRMCASLAGSRNLVFTAWLRSLPDAATFEARLTGQIRDLTVTDRNVTLWTLKLGGHILDPHGRHLRSVPVAPWPDAAASEAEASLLAALR